MNEQLNAVDHGRTPRILICEDEPLLAMEMDQVVRQAGGAVCGLASAHDNAVEFLKADKPDAVLLDIELSDGASTRLAELLTQLQIPFLVVTGLTRPEDVPSPLNSVPWLLKPLQTPELVATLNKLLANGRS